MSKTEDTMNSHTAETERLGQAMATSARTRPEFIGSALELWERANPGRSVQAELCCDDNQLWRLAVTPRPKVSELAETAMALATMLKVNPRALANILRFAETANAFSMAKDNGEMLMAALDSEDEKGDRD